MRSVGQTTIFDSLKFQNELIRSYVYYYDIKKRYFLDAQHTHSRNQSELDCRRVHRRQH